MTYQHAAHQTLDTFEDCVEVDTMVATVSLDNESPDTIEDVVACLKFAESLVERAGYCVAGMNRKGNVVEMMLIAAQIGRIADAMYLQTLEESSAHSDGES